MGILSEWLFGIYAMNILLPVRTQSIHTLNLTDVGDTAPSPQRWSLQRRIYWRSYDDELLGVLKIPDLNVANNFHDSSQLSLLTTTQHRLFLQLDWLRLV